MANLDPGRPRRSPRGLTDTQLAMVARIAAPGSRYLRVSGEDDIATVEQLKSLGLVEEVSAGVGYRLVGLTAGGCSYFLGDQAPGSIEPPSHP